MPITVKELRSPSKKSKHLAVSKFFYGDMHTKHLVFGIVVATDGSPGRVYADRVCKNVELYARHVILPGYDGSTLSPPFQLR